MERQTSKVIGQFKKILWQSSDSKTLIVSFYIKKNDDLNPVSLNKYEGISITFKNNLFADSKIVFEEQDYQLSLIKNQVSKYPDSYLIDLSSEILPIKNKETEINKLNYLVRVLRLPIFKKLVDSKAGILVNELKEDLFFKIIKNQRINGSLFGIEEETW
ncbi:Uncharacterised protein, partial [Metamycoplasma alkalescens]